MSDIPVEKKFAVLSEIARAQHFAWREAVRQLCPDTDPAEVVRRMWELTGDLTAESYARRIDPSMPLAIQVAECIAWSSRCMGEEVTVEPVDGRDEAFLKHSECPWFHWHRRLGLLAEDRPGCDAWFARTVDRLNEALGTDVRFETQGSLPDGDAACVRRFWAEPR